MSELPSPPCPACGLETLPGAGYCHECGARLVPAPEGREATGPHAGAETFAGEQPPMTEEVRSSSFGPASPPPDEGLARALAGVYETRIGDWMSRGWTVFTRAGGFFIAFGAVIWLFFTFASPLLLVFGPVLQAGLLVAALLARRGERVQFSDFWLPFNEFIPLFLAGLVSLAFMFVGLLTCGILTVYLWVGYQFAFLLIMDRRMDFWDALEASRRASGKRWFALFAFTLLLLAINLVAFIGTLTLGIVVSLPLTACALVEAYADIFGVRGRIPGQEPAAAPQAM